MKKTIAVMAIMAPVSANALIAPGRPNLPRPEIKTICLATYGGEQDGSSYVDHVTELKKINSTNVKSSKMAALKAKLLCE